jgi:hypothetical protein
MGTKNGDMLEEILVEAEKEKLKQQLFSVAGGGGAGPLPPSRDPIPAVTTANISQTLAHLVRVL